MGRAYPLASFQFSPMPSSIVSGTVSSAAPSMCARTSAATSPAASRGTSNRSSSWREAPPAGERADDAGLARFGQRPVDEGPHRGEAVEVGVAERLGGRLRDADVPRQREGGLAVEQAVVD